MSKTFSNRIEPMDEWLVVRIPQVAASKKAIAIVEDGKVLEQGQKRNVGIVVSVGPGARAPETGAILPVDPRIKEGATVVFMGKTAQRPPDLEREMSEDGLFFVPASAVICVLKPEGVRAQPALA